MNAHWWKQLRTCKVMSQVVWGPRMIYTNIEKRLFGPLFCRLTCSSRGAARPSSPERLRQHAAGVRCQRRRQLGVGRAPRKRRVMAEAVSWRCQRCDGVHTMIQKSEAGSQEDAHPVQGSNSGGRQLRHRGRSAFHERSRCAEPSEVADFESLKTKNLCGTSQNVRLLFNIIVHKLCSNRVPMVDCHAILLKASSIRAASVLQCLMHPTSPSAGASLGCYACMQAPDQIGFRGSPV